MLQAAHRRGGARRHRHRAAPALQGQRAHRRAARRRARSTTRSWRASTRPAATTRRTPAASSGSPGCGCASGRWSSAAHDDEDGPPRRRTPPRRREGVGRPLRRADRARSSRSSPPRSPSTASSTRTTSRAAVAHVQALVRAKLLTPREGTAPRRAGCARVLRRARRRRASASRAPTRTSTWRSSAG